MCEPLISDVMASEAHQDNYSYVLELLLDSLRRNLARWAVTWRASKIHRGGCLRGDGTGQSPPLP